MGINVFLKSISYIFSVIKENNSMDTEKRWLRLQFRMNWEESVALKKVLFIDIGCQVRKMRHRKQGSGERG